MHRLRLVQGLLLAVAALGFAIGFASLGARRERKFRAFERHVADVCVEAAGRAGGAALGGERPVDERRRFGEP